MIPIPFPPYGASVSAEFMDSPAFIYSLAALSVACLYSIITTLLSFSSLMKPAGKTANLVANFFVIDVLLLGIVASAAGEVAYIGMKGNTHTGWHKICNVYGSFCQHIGLCFVFDLCLCCPIFSDYPPHYHPLKKAPPLELLGSH